VLQGYRSILGGIQLGPLGTAATGWPIVPVPGDYDDGEFGGMKIGRGNRSTRRKPALTPPMPKEDWPLLLQYLKEHKLFHIHTG
jgi:hypothetical protein